MYFSLLQHVIMHVLDSNNLTYYNCNTVLGNSQEQFYIIPWSELHSLKNMNFNDQIHCDFKYLTIVFIHTNNNIIMIPKQLCIQWDQL